MRTTANILRTQRDCIMATSNRKSIDCRNHPSEKNCSLAISGTQEEVMETAAAHGHKSSSPAAVHAQRREIGKPNTTSRTSLLGYDVFYIVLCQEIALALVTSIM